MIFCGFSDRRSDKVVVVCDILSVSHIDQKYESYIADSS